MSKCQQSDTESLSCETFAIFGSPRAYLPDSEEKIDPNINFT